MAEVTKGAAVLLLDGVTMVAVLLDGVTMTAVLDEDEVTERWQSSWGRTVVVRAVVTAAATVGHVEWLNEADAAADVTGRC